MTATFPLPIEDIIAGLNEILDHCNGNVEIGTVGERIVQRIEEKAASLRNVIVALRDADSPTPSPSSGAPQDRIDTVAFAIRAQFIQSVERSSGKAFSETGVAVPDFSIWERYARAALSATATEGE